MNPSLFGLQHQQQHQIMMQQSIAIVEQPAARVRFRYKSEGGNAGNIYGENNSQLEQTFPKVVVCRLCFFRM